MSGQLDAILAAHDAWRTAVDCRDTAQRIVADEARYLVEHTIDEHVDPVNLDFLRRRVDEWKAAEEAVAVAAARADAARRVVVDPLATDSEGGYLREWGAA